ncbi:hypothetical protein [Photobacterium angustum]|uniref:hypothetical protein n=1 Tax=Photobacterium angustum TaxID=661 RepID=UPI00069BB229|nr:hypothetical protein [Photobacterium angustum]
MPEKDKENFTNVHVKNITANLEAITAEPSNENTFEEALESLKKTDNQRPGFIQTNTNII